MVRALGINKNTVERYLDLLTKVFVIYKVTGFSRNLRKEIIKSSKWYFVDNGVRNAVINNFNGMGLRNDVGILWGNYALSERMKHQHHLNVKSYNHFWRTYDQQEIDWVEEREGNFFAYEMKWNKDKKVKTPVAWKNAYPESEFQVINPSNYYEWIVDE